MRTYILLVAKGLIDANAFVSNIRVLQSKRENRLSESDQEQQQMVTITTDRTRMERREHKQITTKEKAS